MNPTIKARIESIRRGEVPEGYKRTKAGIMPMSWCKEKIYQAKDLFVSVSDKKHGGTLEVLSATQDRGIVPRRLVDIDIKYDDSNLGTYKKVDKGDFVISLRSFQGGIEYSDYAGIVSPAYTVVRSKQKIVSGYYKAYFKTEDFIKRLNIGTYGIRDGKQVSFDDFGDMVLHYPPVNEQEKIAEILAGQDRVIALKEKLLAEKQKQKKYLMQQLLTGKKRLPGFSGEWRIVKLKEVLRERDEKNVDQNLEICSVAVQKGVVNQIEHLGRSFAASDTSNYNVVLFGDIVYTKSPTGEFPFGIIKQSQLDKVAVSPLYGVFKPITYALGYILHCYFEIPINTNNYLNSIIQKGAKNTINISNTTFLSNKLLLPMDEKEQTAIAEILSTADKEIELLKKDIEQEKLKKKSLMQLLLTGIMRVDELLP